MKQMFDDISFKTAKSITKKYSTSFSIGTRLFNKRVRKDVYAIYGFVRVADEIVDSFHNYDKQTLLHQYRSETYNALERGISTNPVINAFQDVVVRNSIGRDLIEAFFSSMEKDLELDYFKEQDYKSYIYGSAEVVGLMCLKVFCEGLEHKYNELKSYAKSLGAAFQKVNFLRDIRDDFHDLGRTYFPNLDLTDFSETEKGAIVGDIKNDFKHAYAGIKKLPHGSKLGVYVAYVYYRNLLRKVEKRKAKELMKRRIRIPNGRKLYLLMKSYFNYKLKRV